MTRLSRSFLSLPSLVALAAALPVAAQSVKLNLPLPLDPAHDGGSVSAWPLSPDQTRIVYLAREQGDARAELRSWKVDGSAAPVKLTGAIPPAEDVLNEELQFTPDGSELLFLTRAIEPGDEDDEYEVHEVYRLYRVRATGGSRPVLITDLVYYASSIWLVDGWVVFESSPDSLQVDLRSAPLDGHVGSVLLAEDATILAVAAERAFYISRAGTLFTVRVDGTGRARIDGPSGPGGRVREARVGPDGTRIVFRGDAVVPGQDELFSAPLDGSLPGVRISGTMPNQRDVSRLVAISPDSTRALFYSNADLRPVEELYSAPLDGSAAPVKLNPRPVVNGGVGGGEFSHDGGRVVFVGDLFVDGQVQLFSAPSDGSAPATLLTPFASPGADASEAHLLSGDRVAYLLRPSSSAPWDLYVAPIDGSAAPTRLTQFPAASVDVQQLAASADGSRLLFRADIEVDGRFDVYTVPSDGTTPAVRIDPAVRTFDATLTRDGARVFFTAALPSFAQRDLWMQSADASTAPVQINRTLSPGDVQGDVAAFDLDARGERVVYFADQRQNDRDDLVSVDLTGRLEHVFLNDPSPAPGDIGDFRVFGARCVFKQPAGANPGSSLWSVPLDRSQAPVRLSSATGIAGHFVASPDERQVVFVDHVNGADELYAAPLDGSSPAVRLCGALVAGGRVGEAIAVTPDSSRVLYLADGTQDERFELYVAPLDGSAPPRAISGSFVAGGDVFLAHGRDAAPITPDSRTVVFRADAEVDGRAELFAAPLDGSHARVKLSGSIVPGGGVQSGFRLTSDGARVVFVADRLQDERYELFSAPVDGSAPPLHLSGDLTAEGDVSLFALTPDGARVVYIADERKDERFELFVASIAGGERARVLSAPGIDAGDVTNFELDPRGNFVVYLADPEVDGRAELYFVALDGSAAPRRVSAPLDEGGQVAFYIEITRDSRAVVYLAQEHTDGPFDVFHASIDPRGVVSKLSGPMVPGGSVSGFRVAPDGRRVFYLANQDDVNTTELYLSRRLPAVRAGSR